MAHSPNAVRRWVIRGSLAVILATVVMVIAGTIVFWVLRPYGERVIDYTPAPTSQVVHPHG